MLSLYLGIIGYLIFLLELESPDLGNILFRVDATGEFIFHDDSTIYL